MAKDHSQQLLQLFFEDSNDSLAEWERVCLKLKPGDPPTALVPLFRQAHNIKGGAGLVSLTALHQRVHRFEDFLSIIRDQGQPLTSETIEAMFQLEKLLREWFTKLKTDITAVVDTTEIEKTLQKLTAAGARPKAVIRAIDAPDAGLPPPPAPTLVASPEVTEAPAPPRESIRPQTKAVSPRPEEGMRGDDSSLRVLASRLDHLIQLIGELSLHQAILERASRENALNTQAIRNVIDIKSKLMQDLQDAALTLRMIPIEGMFQKVERVIRETATSLKKAVSVIRLGDDVTLDKLVVERMADPLMHMARNAVDHGIETVEERVAIGKTPNGVIRITAENTVTGVTLTFEDDGRGIDGDALYTKALERGLISTEQSMSPSSRQQLIFLAGLSTKKDVTEISGRGVGMDVVADVVGKMGGRVDVQSTVGKGTRFSINLPTNLSILDALVVKVNGCQYAIPNQELMEVVNLHELDIQAVEAGHRQMVFLRGQPIPVTDMGEFLRHDQPIATDPNEDPFAARPGVVVRFREDFLAMAVDQVVGQQQIFVRPVIESLAPVSFFGGSTILNDGEPSLILNLTEMARHYFEAH